RVTCQTAPTAARAQLGTNSPTSRRRQATTLAKHPVALGIDIGGSGIKGAVVNLEKGQFTTKRKKILTPKPATPDAVIEVVAQLVDHFIDDIHRDTAVCVTVPAVVQHGVVLSAANIDPTWIEFEGEKALQKRLGRARHPSPHDSA